MIDSINVVCSTEDAIKGYANVSVDNLGQVTNGYVNAIMLNCLDKLNPVDRKMIFEESLKKLSINGILTIKFIDILKLSHNLKSGYLTGNQFIEILNGALSAWTEGDILEAISLTQTPCKLNKLYSDNNHIVAIIQKTTHE